MPLRISSIAQCQRERCHEGKTPFFDAVTLATTDLNETSDAVLLYFFGEEEAYFDRLKLRVADLDANGAPTLTFSVGVGDADGVIDTAIYSTLTAGQTGAAITEVHFFPITVTGKYLIFDVVAAAATPQAGDLEFAGEFSAGLRRLKDVAGVLSDISDPNA